MMTWKLSIDFMRDATTIPSVVSVKASNNISSISVMTSGTVSFTPINGAKISMMVPCTMATVLPPNALPSTTEVREMGATNTSRRKPNSRSQTIEMAEKMAVKSTAILNTPGKRNVWKFTPCDAPKLLDKPAPKINRNIKGCTSEVITRIQSRVKRRMSRYQTIKMALILRRRGLLIGVFTTLLTDSVLIYLPLHPRCRIKPRI